MADRRIYPAVEQDLEQKMVLVSGPRQCGKTTLAKQLLSEMGGAYFNWDVSAHRQALRQSVPSLDEPLWVFDEIHKMRGWTRWLKGLYDLYAETQRLLVTGSARLDTYRRGGDSMQGRYFLHRIHPFTLGELLNTSLPALDQIPRLEHVGETPSTRKSLHSLALLGGFPEPFLSGSEARASRWRLAYGALLIRQDLRDLDRVRELDKLETLFDQLPRGVGSLLSLNALREDLEVAHETVAHWLAQLDHLYATFRLSPLGKSRPLPKIRALKKASKLYFWDWGRVSDPAARFENLVVAHLVRFGHYIEDVFGKAAEVRFFRDTAGHEVDAILLLEGKPWLAVEAKSADRPLDAGLQYLLERIPIPYAFQVSENGTTDKRLPDIGASKVRMVPAARFLAALP